jgi:hypothetical protein
LCAAAHRAAHTCAAAARRRGAAATAHARVDVVDLVTGDGARSRRCDRTAPSRETSGVGPIAQAEPVAPERDVLSTLLSDVNMLVITGGRERTDGGYERLFGAAGLRLPGDSRRPSVLRRRGSMPLNPQR